MSMSDPIADMLTRIRNANSVRHTVLPEFPKRPRRRCKGLLGLASVISVFVALITTFWLRRALSYKCSG